MVVEVTPTGVVIESPTDPELPVGAITHIEVEGLRGLLIAESTRVDSRTARAYHTIRVVETDSGLLEAVWRAARRRRSVINVLGPGTVP